jgi:4-coumarate--CoA ligase
MVHQIKTTGTQLILVHPTVLETALEAASRAGLSKDRLFLFSDQELEPIQGVQDWRRMIGTEDEAEKWRWAKLSPEESRNTVATINYSSG